MGEATEPHQKRDWLDVVAPVKQDAVREAAGGLFLFAVVCIGLGILMLLVFPFWQTGSRGIPLGVLGLLALPSGVWFALIGANVLRRTER